MGYVVGIDLGTTYSAVAMLGDDGLPQILNNAEGESTTPSVVLFQTIDGKDEPLVGTMAKHSVASDPDNVVQFVKRNMGDPSWRFDSESGASYSPEEVSALILKKLKQDAELALGDSVDGAVITVPAYFDDSRRVATKQAGRIAGLNVLRVLNEPTAAALSYGLDVQCDGTVLVYDLGGGTFDVTLLNIEGSNFKVAGTDGDRNLGGFDFDNELMKLVAADFSAQGSRDVLADFELRAELREKCEMAKRALSNVEKTVVFMTVDGKSYRSTITRAAFEDAVKTLMSRTEEIMQDVLDDSGYSWDAVDRIVLIGGSTRMPMVKKMIERVSGKKPETGINPDEAVALGAAIQAVFELDTASSYDFDAPSSDGMETAKQVAPTLAGEKISIEDVTSHPLGVVMVDDNDRPYNEVVIPRNTPVPASCSKSGCTVVANQRTIDVQVTQGDDPDLSFVVVVGSKEIPLPPGLPIHAPLRVTYVFDVEQTIHVEMTDETSGKSLGRFSIERVANMDSIALEKSVQKIRDISIN